MTDEPPSSGPMAAPVSKPKLKRKWPVRVFMVLIVVAGLMRGWIAGIQQSQDDNRAEGFSVRIDSEEIGVRLETMSGELELLSSAGYHWVVPGMSEVFRISRAPVTIVYGGERNERPRLAVRAADGTSFDFDEVRLTYRVSESGALRFVRDSGTDTRRAADWVANLARPILREEFGAHTVQQVTDALVVDEARNRAVDRLTEELIEHGIELVGITASKPNFDRNYETAIAKRKVADQEAERLIEDLDDKLRERTDRLAKAELETAARDQQLDGDIEQERIAAETNALKARGAVDSWAIKRLSEADSYNAELTSKAATVRAKGEATVALFESELLSLAAQGDAAIRERWIAALSKTKFRLTPMRLDTNVESVQWLDSALGGR